VGCTGSIGTQVLLSTPYYQNWFFV
jgi:hypothetical protein